MNLIALLAGLALAFLLIYLFKQLSLENRPWSYPLLLVSFPVFYWGFPLFQLDFNTLVLELLPGLFFITLALLYLKLPSRIFIYILGSGYLLHAAYDWLHNYLFINTGVPRWWPEFCGMIDLAIGLYLILYFARTQALISNY